MAEIRDYVKYGAITGGVIGTAVGTYEFGKMLIDTTASFNTNYFEKYVIRSVIVAVMSPVWGAVVGGIPGAVAGAAGGAIIGGAKKGLEAIVSSLKS